MAAAGARHMKRTEKRPSRNRGGGSGTAALTGVPRAPGGLGRADIRSVRIPGAIGSGVVREGTARSKPGKRRPGVTRSPLRAGCFSHLPKPYGTGSAPVSRITWPPLPPHIFFTRYVRFRLSW
ncbi:hypothetical protein GCM10010211_06760 [Streptomyces albospinus]|uniref:Uncharacterized protein n=1 Tax=Streptomyces albospinus TaxID=285515 RepID=A0ABQ2UMX4_9ACTN|nr:hypothetical protein GCM10010211_06760 [Streptomyces albospinus]